MCRNTLGICHQATVTLPVSCPFLYFILVSLERSKGKLQASGTAAPHVVALHQLESSPLPGLPLLIDSLP